MENKKATGFSFDDMFGGAQEFIPNPADMVEGDFESLDEEGDASEDELADIDCSGIEASSDEAEELVDDVDSYGEPEDEDDEQADSDEGLSDDESLVEGE